MVAVKAPVLVLLLTILLQIPWKIMYNIHIVHASIANCSLFFSQLSFPSQLKSILIL